MADRPVYVLGISADESPTRGRFPKVRKMDRHVEVYPVHRLTRKERVEIVLRSGCPINPLWLYPDAISDCGCLCNGDPSEMDKTEELFPVFAQRLREWEEAITHDGLERTLGWNGLTSDEQAALRDGYEQDTLPMCDVDGFEESDGDLLDILVSDGGEVAPKDIAESKGWHIDTIYRAIDRLEDLVEHHYGELSLRSHYIAQRVSEAVQHAREDIEDAATTLAKSLESTVGLEVANDALLEWIDGLGIDVDDRRDAQLVLRFGRVDETRYEFVVTLTNGLKQWMRAGWDREQFLNAEVKVKLKDGRCQMQARHFLA